MTDPVDTNAETRSAIEALLPKAIAELQQQIDTGGTKTIRVQCQHCGRNNSHDIKVADADLLVKAVSALSSALPRMQSKDDAIGAKATRILSDFSDMTSAELAEYIVQLEALHGQDDHPD